MLSLGFHDSAKDGSRMLPLLNVTSLQHTTILTESFGIRKQPQLQRSPTPFLKAMFTECLGQTLAKNEKLSWCTRQFFFKLKDIAEQMDVIGTCSFFAALTPLWKLLPCKQLYNLVSYACVSDHDPSNYIAQTHFPVITYCASRQSVRSQQDDTFPQGSLRCQQPQPGLPGRCRTGNSHSRTMLQRKPPETLSNAWQWWLKNDLGNGPLTLLWQQSALKNFNSRMQAVYYH